MAEQDFETRRRRLASGGCPVHNIGLCQTGDFYVKADGTSFAIFSCPRHDCGITVRGHPGNNFWEVTPETAPLVGEAPDTSKIYNHNELTALFGPINSMLAIRAYEYSTESGENPIAIIEAALSAYLSRRGAEH